MARRRREATASLPFVIGFVFLLSASRFNFLLFNHGERWLCSAGGDFTGLGWKLSSDKPTAASLSRESKPRSVSNRRPRFTALNLFLLLSTPLTAGCPVLLRSLSGLGFPKEIWQPTDEANISIPSRVVSRSTTLPASGRRTLKIPEELCCDSVLAPLKIDTPRRNLPTISLTDGGPIETHPTWFPSLARSPSDLQISDNNASASLHRLDLDVEEHHRKKPSPLSPEVSVNPPMCLSRRWRLYHKVARRSKVLGRTPSFSL